VTHRQFPHPRWKLQPQPQRHGWTGSSA